MKNYLEHFHLVHISIFVLGAHLLASMHFVEHAYTRTQRETIDNAFLLHVGEYVCLCVFVFIKALINDAYIVFDRSLS